MTKFVFSIVVLVFSADAQGKLYKFFKYVWSITLILVTVTIKLVLTFSILDSTNYDASNNISPDFNNDVLSNNVAPYPADMVYNEDNFDPSGSLDYNNNPKNMNPPAMDPLEYPYNLDESYPNSNMDDPQIYFNSDNMVPNSNIK